MIFRQIKHDSRSEDGEDGVTVQEAFGNWATSHRRTTKTGDALISKFRQRIIDMAGKTELWLTHVYIVLIDRSLHLTSLCSWRKPLLY